jgi:hypothetical protein
MLPNADNPVPVGCDSNGHGHPAVDDVWNADNQSVNLGGQAPDNEHDLLAAETDPDINPELDRIRRENAQLREIIAELKQQANERQSCENQEWRDRQKELEALVEEKTEVIRSLHQKLREQGGLAAPAPLSNSPHKEDELLALSEELDRERCQLQQERRQLEEERQQFRDDEQLMTKQMRDMEVQMARERADFARQRNELTRIYDEIRREIDNIERNGLLNQRLGQLRQRFQETGVPSGSAPASRPGSSSALPAARAEAQPVESPDPENSQRKESFLGRIFG